MEPVDRCAYHATTKRAKGVTQLVTVKSNGKALGNNDAALPALSQDGNWVAFAAASPYVSNDQNNNADIYERGALRFPG